MSDEGSNMGSYPQGLTPAAHDTLRILSTHAVQGALPGMIAAFEAQGGAPVTIDYAPTNGLLPRIKAGERADIAIATRQGVDELAGLGILEAISIVDLACSRVGIAVRAGAPRPDISTPEALTRTLLASRSIAYSGLGASGVLFAGLIRRLGIADAVHAKATVIPSGLTAVLVARGEVEMAVQQLSELMAVPGVDIVGPLPATLQTPTVFSGAVFAASARPREAHAFLDALASGGSAAFIAAGLEPVAPAAAARA